MTKGVADEKIFFPSLIKRGVCVVKSAIRFVQEVQLELAKIVWPSLNELVGSVIIVLILVCFFSIYIGSIDVVFYKIAGQIF